MSLELLDQLYKSYPIYKELFDKQLEFVLAPTRYVAALCSRRAGKSTVCAVKAIQDLLTNPNSMGLYLALTDKSVKTIFMPAVRPLLAKYKINAKVKEDEIEFSNGSTLLVLGANHINKVENFRGTKLLFCIIDEAGSFSENILQYLVDEIITPALADLQGQLIMIGTPLAHCSGMFHDVTNTTKEAGWTVLRWTAFDNPHMKKQWDLEAVSFLKRKKADSTLPKYRREYLGEWCGDDESMLIKAPSFEIPEAFDKESWRTVFGLDFGFEDETVISVIGWRRNNPKAYVLESVGLHRASVSTIGNTLRTLKAKYNPFKVVGDPAGSSKVIMEEYRTKYGVAIESAQKTNKAHYIEILNDALVNGNLVLVPSTTTTLQEQIKKVVWDENHEREREGQACDHIDAMLYGYRSALAFLEKIPTKVERTDDVIAKEMEQEMIKKVKRKHQATSDDDFLNYVSVFLGDNQ